MPTAGRTEDMQGFGRTPRMPAGIEALEPGAEDCPDLELRTDGV